MAATVYSLAIMAAAPAAMAQTSAQETAERQFSVPAGPLGQSILAVSRTFGVAVIAPSALVEGKQAPAVSGAMTAAEALGRLLAGSNLIARPMEEGGFVLAQQMPARKDDGPIRLAPITVTGERVERTIAETASSVTVITGEELNSRPEDRTVEDVLQNIPNIVRPGTESGFYIRGQSAQGPNFAGGAFFAGTVPRASIIVDGRVSSYNELVYGDASTWDLERIEVFRGPQTTSQGANSIAGAIYIQTKDPSFEPEAAAQGEVGNFQSRRGSAMVSGPIVEDQLAARVSFDYQIQEDYVDFTNPSFASGLDTDERLLNGRVKLLWEPEALPELQAKLTYTHANVNSPDSRRLDQPFEDLETNVGGSASPFETTTDALIFDTAYDVSQSFTITNQIQYSRVRTDRSTIPATAASAEIDLTDFANEMKVNFETFNAALSGVAGVYFRQRESDDFLNFFGKNTFDDKKTGFGIFSELTYELTDDLSVTGGLRYQRDRVRRRGSSDILPGTPLDFDRTFDAFLPKLSVAYDVTKNVTVGALVSRGYNPGGVSLSFSRQSFVEFDQEMLWNYELFTRAAFLDNRFRLSANAFYSDFEDAQRFSLTIIPSTSLSEVVTINAEEARSFGLELAADYAAFDWLRVFGGVGLLKTKFEKFTDSSANLQGNEFENAPSYTLNAGFELDILPTLTLGATVRQTDGYYSDDTNSDNLEVDPFTIADFKLLYSPAENVSLYAFVNNAFNEIAPVEKLLRGGDIQAEIEHPREYGIGARIKF